MDEQQQLVGELVGFLLDPKPEVRQIAAQHLKNYTTSSEGKEILRKTPALTNLTRLLGDITAVATHAYTCLINLSEEQDFALQLVQKPRFCTMLARNIVDPENKLAALEAMLLCNLTRLEEGCQQVLQVGEEMEGFYFCKMVEVFCRRREEGKKDNFGWIGTVLMNVTQLPQARKIMLDPEQRILRDILPDIGHSNLIRRRGVIGTIKNCCFDQLKHEWLLGEDGLDILPHLLFPLVGPEPFTREEMEGMPASITRLGSNKRREEDLECRRMLVAALGLLTVTKFGREIMRKKKVYPIIRNFHKVESDEKIGDTVTMLVDHLMREEAPTTPASTPAPAAQDEEPAPEIVLDEEEEEEKDKKKEKEKEGEQQQEQKEKGKEKVDAENEGDITL
jgi:hypothetical protein